MAGRRIRLVAVAIVPLLMGGDAACPPELGYTIFDGTVTSVERASYHCETRAHEHPVLCILAQGAAKSCTGGDLVVVGSDGVAHSMRAEPSLALAVCDLPAGSYQVTVCTPEGPRTCTAQIDATTGAVVTPAGSLPHHFRYHVRTSAGVDRVLDSDTVELHAGERWRFQLPVPEVPTLEPCHLRTVPAPAPAHGCGHCDAGEPDLAALLLVLIALLPRRGR